MAIDESTLYTVTDEEITRTSIVQEMINFYNLLFEVGDTRVTDFNEGSEIRNLLETYAVDGYGLREDQNELTKIAFIETAEGEWLDKHGAKPDINLPREQGTYASGFVQFTIPSAAETDIPIPIETVLTCTDNDMDYTTDSQATIEAGSTTSGLVSCTCTVDGYDGNCDAGTITIVSDDDIDIAGLTVTNPSKFDGGVDYEEDDDYRQRLLEYEKRDDFGSLPYYEELGNNVAGVHDVLFTEDPNDVYTRLIYVNGDAKPTPSSVLAEVLETFSVPTNVVLNHTFNVTTPSYVHTWLDVTLTVENLIVDDDIEALLQSLFDGGGALAGLELEGLSIGETLTKDAMDSTLDLLDDVVSSTVKVKYSDDGSTWDSSWANFSDKSVGATSVLKLDKVDITQNTTGD